LSDTRGAGLAEKVVGTGTTSGVIGLTRRLIGAPTQNRIQLHLIGELCQAERNKTLFG
jgi:hypothetical protein